MNIQKWGNSYNLSFFKSLDLSFRSKKFAVFGWYFTPWIRIHIFADPTDSDPKHCWKCIHKLSDLQYDCVLKDPFHFDADIGPESVYRKKWIRNQSLNMSLWLFDLNKRRILKSYFCVKTWTIPRYFDTWIRIRIDRKPKCCGS